MQIKFIIIILISFFFITDTFSQKNQRYKLKTVVIDAGHGGKDPGALGKVSKEKTITLAIALKLGYYIEKNLPDVKVIYTRKTNKFIELDKRAQIANENNADLFISIHVNSSDIKSVRGTSTYVMGLHKTEENLELAQKENSVILLENDYTSRYRGYDPNSSESYIIFSLMVNTFQSQSLFLADKIQKQFRKRAGRRDRGVKQAGFVVLYKCTMPSVLIETGFITNRAEEKFLNSRYGQEIIASAIFRAFRDYKKELERKTSVGGTVVKKTTKNEQKQLVKEKPRKQNKKNKPQSVSKKRIVFKVQIKSSSSPIALNPKNFKGYKNVQELKQAGRYKYYIGNEKTVNDAVLLQRKIRKKYSDAFVVAFKNGKRIPYKQAVKEVSQK